MPLWRRKRRETALVTIDVVGNEPDALERIALLNNTFLRVIAGGAKLVEVKEADYKKGHMEVVVAQPRSRPPNSGRVVVRYRPLKG